MLTRNARRTDLPYIVGLQEKLAAEEIIYGFVAETAEEIARPQYLLVAETGDEIIGFISGSARAGEGSAVVPEGARQLEIDHLYVAPLFRKQGTGGRLVGELLSRAKRDGAEYALLYSATKEIAKVFKFYERHNFQSWSVHMFQKL